MLLSGLGSLEKYVCRESAGSKGGLFAFPTSAFASSIRRRYGIALVFVFVGLLLRVAQRRDISVRGQGTFPFTFYETFPVCVVFCFFCPCAPPIKWRLLE